MRKPPTERRLERARSQLAAARARLAAAEVVDELLDAYLERVIRRLEAWIDHPPHDARGGMHFAHALDAFLEILELEWLPAERRERSEWTEEELALFEDLAQQRRIMVSENNSVPPGPARYLLSLADLALESLQVFSVYENEIGRLWSLAILGDLTRGPSEAGAEEKGEGWVC